MHLTLHGQTVKLTELPAIGSFMVVVNNSFYSYADSIEHALLIANAMAYVASRES